METSTQISTGNWAYWKPQVSQGGTHFHNIRSSLNKGNWTSVMQYAKAVSSHDTILNNYPRVGDYFVVATSAAEYFTLFFLNGGAISLRPLRSRWVFNNVNPLSAMIHLQSARVTKVLSFSAIEPGYAAKTKLMHLVHTQKVPLQCYSPCSLNMSSHSMKEGTLLPFQTQNSPE